MSQRQIYKSLRNTPESNFVSNKRSKRINANALKYDIVISGMGSAALYVALVAIQLGKSVLIINNQPSGFIRINAVILPIPIRQQLWDMVPKEDFQSQLRRLKDQRNPALNEKIQELEDELLFLDALECRVPITVKYIERFLMRRINEGGGNLRTLYQSQLCAIDLRNGVAEIESLLDRSTETIKFVHLIGADGVRSHALSVLHQSSVYAREMIQMQALPTHTLSRFNYVAMYVSVARKDGEVLNLPKSEAISFCFGRTIFNFEIHEHAPYPKSIKCYLIAQTQIDHPHEEQMLFELTMGLQAKLKEMKYANGELDIQLAAPSQKYGARKDKLRFSCFKQQSFLATHAAIEENGHCFFLHGDARYNAHFYSGFGILCLFKQGDRLKLFLNGEISLDGYNDTCMRLTEMAENKMQYHNNVTNRQLALELTAGAERAHRVLAIHDFRKPGCVIM